MATRKAKGGITRQHADALADVIAWAKAHPETTPLELGVLEEMRERVAQRAKDAAIFRVRLMNHPNPSRPNAAQRAPARPRRRPEHAGEAREWGGGREWSVEEMERLRALFDEGLVFEEIAERIEGRSLAAIQTQASRMELKRARVYRSRFPQASTRERKPARLVRYNTGGPLTRAREVLHERRMREARARRDGLGVAS